MLTTKMNIAPVLINSSAQTVEGMSLADYARELLIDKFVSLELAPGTAIVERELLTSLNLGRTPVREALQQIAGIGLLCRLPHIGMYVCEVDQDNLREIYELRSMMDSRVAELAARRAQPAQVAAIVSAAKEIEAAHQANDLRRFTVAGWHFARRMAEATDNRHIVELMPRMYYLDARLTWMVNRAMGRWDVLGWGIVETALSLAGVIVRKLPHEAKLLADLHVERRFSYLTAELDLSPSKATYHRRAS